MDILKTKKVGPNTWYLVNTPIISDYSATGGDVYRADYIQRMAAREENAHYGRGFYLYDHTGDVVYVGNSLKDVLHHTTLFNNEATNAG